jgi:glycine cleavage system H protein
VKIPDELRYTAEHEWVRGGEADSSSGSSVRVGITDFAQDSLGDIVYVQLPEVGAEVSAGEPLGEVESTKSVSEIYAPISGEVTAINQAVVDDPELINSDPYGEGWLVEIRPADTGSVTALLDAQGYGQLTA